MLRGHGVRIIVYIDDIIPLADDPKTLIEHIDQTMRLFKSLGFTINEEKSQLVPSQKVTFLGFILDSFTMTVFIKSDKAEKVKTAICRLLKKGKTPGKKGCISCWPHGLLFPRR